MHKILLIEWTLETDIYYCQVVQLTKIFDFGEVGFSASESSSLWFTHSVCRADGDNWALPLQSLIVRVTASCGQALHS